LKEESVKVRCSRIAVFILLVCVATPALAQTAVRVGIFDSRGIAIAHAQSPAFGQEIQQLRAQFQQAKTDKNETLAAALETKGQTLQALLHLQGFSIGSVSEILAKFTDAVAAVAKEAKVSAIVSQYELVYQGPDIETVDVTEALVKKINDSPKVVANLGELKNHKPLPMLDALSLRDKD
jgi:Skp family chaperone for outer membrane proteins